MPNPSPLFESSVEAGAASRSHRPYSAQTSSSSKDTLPASSAPDFADMLLDLAAAVEAQEASIKAVLLEAAEAGNLDLIKKIVGVWATGPVSEVMAQLRDESCVDSTDARVA